MAARKKTYSSSRGKENKGRTENNALSSLSSSDEDDRLPSSARYNFDSKGSSSNDYYGRIHIETDQHITGPDSSRKEENPFSFRHFLRSESQTNYNKTGARPKIYSPCASSPGSLEKDIGVYSRNPTELPDFVQDHLVIEQCYLNHEFDQQGTADIDNLPDFALNSVGQRQSRHRNDLKKSQSQVLCDLPFDLTGSLDNDTCHRNHSTINNHAASCSKNVSNNNLSRHERPSIDSEPAGFPFDLPLPLAEPDTSTNTTSRDCTSSADANIPKSLPDFLSDGLIYNRTAPSSNAIGSDCNIEESTETKLLLENERLRQELDTIRRQVNEKSIRIQSLESELTSRREVDHQETIHLEKAMEQVEDNLKRSMQRAVNAESTVSSLKKEIKSLTTEISLLRLENTELRSAIGAVSDNNPISTNVNSRVRRLAGDLRKAASSAEISLRQLMSGVDNLKVLASALENVDRIEDRTKDFLPDFDEDNATDGSPL